MRPKIVLSLYSDSWKIVIIMPNAVFCIWLAFCGSLGELSGSGFDPTVEKKEGGGGKENIYPAVILLRWCNLLYLRTKIMVSNPILLYGKYV